MDVTQQQHDARSAGNDEGPDASTSLADHNTVDMQSDEEEEEEAPTVVNSDVSVVFAYYPIL